MFLYIFYLAAIAERDPEPLPLKRLRYKHMYVHSCMCVCVNSLMHVKATPADTSACGAAVTLLDANTKCYQRAVT